MDVGLFELLGFGGTGLATTAAVLALFWNADSAFSGEFRNALSKKLQGLRINTEGVEWPGAFAKTFDRVFGARHLTIQCFLRSSLASIAALLALTTLALTTSYPFGVGWSDVFYGPFLSLMGALLAVMGLLTIALNSVIDYLSLLETRFVIRQMMRTRRMMVQAAWLLADTLITFMIFLFVSAAATYLGTFLGAFEGVFESFTDEIRSGNWDQEVLARVAETTNKLPELLIVVALGTTFTTSLWLWIYVVGWATLRNGARFQRVLAVLQWALPIKTRPMRAVGEVAALAMALAFIVLGIFGVDFGGVQSAAQP